MWVFSAKGQGAQTKKQILAQRIGRLGPLAQLLSALCSLHVKDGRAPPWALPAFALWAKRVPLAGGPSLT